MSQKGNQAVKAVSFMMMITLTGKILGLVREQFLAANYGLGMEAVAFLIASQIPRTFFDAVFASAISASFIPIFNEYLQKEGKEEAFSLANRFITLISAVTLVMMLFGIVFSEQFVWLFANGFDAKTAALSASLARILFPTILFTAMAFSFVGILQSLDEFNIPAAISVASNAIIIIYFVFFNSKFGIYGLTSAFLIGWAMQAFIQIPSLQKKGYWYRPDFHFRDEGLKKIGKLMLPVMIGTWVQPINFMINCRFASQLYNGKEKVAALQYANNLYTIIVGVFVLAIANLIFPKLSRISSGKDKEKFGSTVKITLRSMMFLLIPMMVGIMALSRPLVALIYERGSFGAEGTLLTSTALFFFSLGVMGYGVQTILSRAFYANQDGKTPFFSGIVSVVTNAILCSLLLKPMGLGGLALSAAVSSIVSAVVLLGPAVKRYPEIIDKKLVVSLGKMAICAMVMLLFVLGSFRILEPRMGTSLFGRILVLGIPTGIGVLAYMVPAFLLGVEEAKMVFSAIGRLKNMVGNSIAGEETAKKARKQRGYIRMLHEISWWLEDSFCFRVLEKIIITIVRIWLGSLTYACYRKVCQGVGNAFYQSGILGFLRRNWDAALGVWHGIFPRTWHRLTILSSKAVKGRSNALAAAMAESFILRIFNQNFIILCLCAIVFAIPILPTMLLALLCLGTLGLYAINLFLGRIRVQRTSFVSIFMGLFGICFIYGSLTSYHFPKALLVMAIFLLFMSMFFVAKDCIDTEEKLDFVLFVMISVGVFIALYAVYQYIVGVEMDAAWVDAESFNIRTRAYATFNNPNVLGEYLIIIGSLTAGMLWKVRNWFGRIFYAGCFGVICLGLLATNSRGAMLGLMFSAGLFVLLAERRLIPLGLVGLLVMPFVLPQELWARLASSLTMNDSSSLYRLSIYRAGFDMVKHYWATGIGVDAFNQVYPLFSYEAANAYHVHNLFLQEFIELGFYGFAILLFLLFFFFQKLYSAMQKVPKRFHMLLAAFFGGFAGLLLQGMTDHIWFDYSIVLLFWCFIGIGMASVRVGEKQWQKEK
ncbi:MAG: murein biosynthesis integral membrane protein MurJ [Anaerotignum sp.]|nr:murein biosynthesis integral membrane protein MurJ [Anaerotignum sp.]